MRSPRRKLLAVAALALAAGALAQEAQDIPEGDAREDETLVARAATVRELGEAPEPPAALANTTPAELAAAQEQWNAERDELLAAQARTAAELRALRELNADLQNDRQIRWMLVGGGLLVVGIVLGVLIKSRPTRRDAWQ